MKGFRPQPEPEACFPWSREYALLEHQIQTLKDLGIGNPYFRRGDRAPLNFSSYDYLGLSRHPRVLERACAAMAQGGTSVSASRMVGGERSLHRELEEQLAAFLGVEDCLTFVGGHATNVTVLGSLFGPRDLLIHDTRAHNSIVTGCVLSRGTRRVFAHNDLDQLEHLLARHRHRHQRCLIAVEGVYSMDGDLPDLPRILELKTRYQACLLVDEAHSLGVLGATGRGVGEHFQVERGRVELWMGTLSKALASCGGYIAASHRLVKLLKFTTPGFVYSVGAPLAQAGAALAALEILVQEPGRVGGVQARAHHFRRACRKLGLAAGGVEGSAIVPLLVGDSSRAMVLSHRLEQRGMLVMPYVYPAVEEGSALLRFFVTADHSLQQLEETASILRQECDQIAEQQPLFPTSPAHLPQNGRHGLPEAARPESA